MMRFRINVICRINEFKPYAIYFKNSLTHITTSYLSTRHENIVYHFPNQQNTIRCI